MSWYDYIIETTSTPAFESNTELMLDKIISDSGMGPTVIKATENTPSKADVMVDTKSTNGRNLLHFRLPVRMNETELLSYLLQPMVNPKPTINVRSIRSVNRVVEINNKLEYETVVIADKSKFLPYMNNNSYLSCYLGVEPIKPI